MSQTNRADFLSDLGYEEPFDNSPINVPNGWHGGSVLNTGGNIFCRIWRTWEAGEHAGQTEYEVIYDISQNVTVGLQAYTWDEELEGYTFDHKIKSVDADRQDDHALAEIAKQLMQGHNSSN